MINPWYSSTLALATGEAIQTTRNLEREFCSQFLEEASGSGIDGHSSSPIIEQLNLTMDLAGTTMNRIRDANIATDFVSMGQHLRTLTVWHNWKL